MKLLAALSMQSLDFGVMGLIGLVLAVISLFAFGATLADPGFPNLVNVMKRLKPDGAVDQMIAELLAKNLPTLDDIPWVPTNKKTGHLITGRHAIPTPKWKKFNKGITRGKSETLQFEETCGMLEDRLDIDVKLAETMGDPAAYRASEEKAFLEGFSQHVGTAVFYENGITNAERIHGLSPRYPATTGFTTSGYVMKGTNAGTNCRSIWLINWDPDKIFGIYPEGSAAGFKRNDKGERYVVTDTATGEELLVFTTQFNWDCGIAVKDYRYAVRFQWDPDDANMADSAKGLYLGLQKMMGKIFRLNTAQARFYMDRTSKEKLDAQLASNDANFLSWLSAGNERIQAFQGVPIRIDDSLVEETAIS